MMVPCRRRLAGVVACPWRIARLVGAPADFLCTRLLSRASQAASAIHSPPSRLLTPRLTPVDAQPRAGMDGEDPKKEAAAAGEGDYDSIELGFQEVRRRRRRQAAGGSRSVGLHLRHNSCRFQPYHKLLQFVQSHPPASNAACSMPDLFDAVRVLPLRRRCWRSWRAMRSWSGSGRSMRRHVASQHSMSLVGSALLLATILPWHMPSSLPSMPCNRSARAAAGPQGTHHSAPIRAGVPRTQEVARQREAAGEAVPRAECGDCGGCRQGAGGAQAERGGPGGC